MNIIVGRKPLGEIIKDIRDNSDDSVILVEGRRDKNALRSAGVPNCPIIQVSYKNNNQIYREVMSYNREKVILLYDNDRTGEDKYCKLKGFFTGLGMKLLDYRRALENAGITYIEEIDDRLAR